MFLPVKFWRVSLSLIFIWTRKQAKMLTSVSVRELYAFIILYYFDRISVGCHQPVGVEVRQRLPDTPAASSCALRSCTRTLEMDFPWSSCLGRTSPSHFQRLAGRTTRPLLQCSGCPWSAERDKFIFNSKSPFYASV